MIVAESEENDGSHAEEDENYFVSMTDMMVGILFIFIIMLMVFALNFRQQTDITEVQAQDVRRIAQQIAEIRKEIEGEIAALNKSEQARTELLEAIKTRLDAVGLKVTIERDTGVLRLTDDAIRFANNSSTLDEAASRNVDAVSQALLDVLPDYTACPLAMDCSASTGHVVETIYVEGHTDKNGTSERNWTLSTERAVETYRQMVDNFPGLRALVNSGRREILSVSGYADTRPAVDRDDQEGYQINRRIDLRFVMEANRGERLNEVLELLDQMERKVDDLIRPAAKETTTETSLPVQNP